jgi:DNA-directed RNA polymerase subunit F
MIKNSEPLSMTEALEYIKKGGESEAEIIGFINKFNKLKAKEAKELRKDTETLGVMKIKPEYIVKIIDLLPENTEELNKIFVDVSLDGDETKKILDAIKKYK